MAVFEADTWLSAPREEVFSFFADARSLSRLTPEWLHFELVTPEPIEMREGTLIDYKLRLRGMPIRWRSEITAWDPPCRFADEQRRGPYRSWRHDHLFLEQDGGTLVRDRVDYEVPGGALVDRLIVRPDLERIFEHRQAKLREIFGRR